MDVSHTEGILLVDKPVGITSYDVIRRLKKRFNDPRAKMGHAGTLDPRASGLMIIGIGEGTKKLKEYVGLSKEYIAEIFVGEQRTTGDMEGRVLAHAHVPQISSNVVNSILQEMVGTLRLLVPAYSAVKRGGQPLYKKAHQGEDVGVLPVRDMEVYEATLIDHVCTDARCVTTVRFHVASGVYVRSLGEEYGRRLGYPAVLQSLHRTKIGEFDVTDAQIRDL